MSPVTGDDRGISVGAWMDLVRRARVSKELKLAMLVFGSYADADGTNIFCGIARLAVDCDVSHKTASRYLSWMREVGFVELVARGNRRRGLSDRYRLILDPALQGRIDLPDPDQYKKLIGEIAGAKRAETKHQQQRARARLMDTQDDHKTEKSDDGLMDAQVSPNESPAEEGLMDTEVSLETCFRGHDDPSFMDTHGVPPPSIDHLTSLRDLPWERAEVRNARLLSARASEEDEEDSSMRRPPVMVEAGPTPSDDGRGNSFQIGNSSPPNEDDEMTTPPRWMIGRGGLPLPGFERVPIQSDGPTCSCGMLLEPDGTCFVCRR